MRIKIIIFVYCIFLLFSSPCRAETIYLKSGIKVEGKIVEKTDQQVKVDISGITLTYFADEIDRIEGESNPAPAPQPQIPASIPPTQRIEDSSSNLIKLPPPQPEEISPESPALSVDVNTPLSPSANKQQLIWKLIEVSGTKANMDKIFADMLSKASADESEKIQALFNIDEIVLQLVPIYDKYFEQDELQQLVDFYNSKGGQKLLEVTPLVTQESMEATLQYFQNKMQSLESPQ